MDSFDLDSLDRYIRKYKRNIVNKFENVYLTENDMRNQADLLCMVLEYSPRIAEERKLYEKFKLNTNVQESNENKNIPNKTLILEKQTNSDTSEDEKDNTIKLSRFSSRISKKDSSNSFYYDQVVSKANTVFIKVKELTYEIINKAIEKIKDKEDSDDEDDYFKQIDMRNNIRQSIKETNSILNSRFANKFNENSKIRIYILNTHIYCDLVITFNDTIKDLKHKVLNYIQCNSKVKIKYDTIEAYEVRMVDEDDEIVPNMEMAPFDDKVLLVKTKLDTFAFVEKSKFDPIDSSLNVNILGTSVKNSEVKITLKIYFKMENGSKSTIIAENGDKTLKNVLERLSSKSKINYKNFDLYYFVEHNEKDEEDIDNAINFETQLKFLNNFELDLYFRKFPDAPESKSFSHASHMMSYSNAYNLNSKTKNDEEEGREYIFNDMSAVVYQEFEVIKINKYKSKQIRTLGIDLYNLYNDLPKAKAQNNLLNLFYGGTKKPLRKIKDILNCEYVTNKTFYIEVMTEGKTKQIFYEVRNINVRNEIVAKIKYLIKMNQNNL